jgi:cobalt-zinc-cadmium resistance protein CzcA
MIVVPGCFFLIFLLLSALGSRAALLVFSAVPLFAHRWRCLWLRICRFGFGRGRFIALSGVAVWNGLVMLSFIKQLIGEDAFLAIYQGAITRCGRSR